VRILPREIARQVKRVGNRTASTRERRWCKYQSGKINIASARSIEKNQPPEAESQRERANRGFPNELLPFDLSSILVTLALSRCLPCVIKYTRALVELFPPGAVENNRKRGTRLPSSFETRGRITSLEREREKDLRAAPIMRLLRHTRNLGYVQSRSATLHN